MMITRCVCFNKKFAELKKIADKNNAECLEELQMYVRFGLNCKRCHPYVERMLTTNETIFEVFAEAVE